MYLIANFVHVTFKLGLSKPGKKAALNRTEVNNHCFNRSVRDDARQLLLYPTTVKSRTKVQEQLIHKRGMYQYHY